MSSRFFTIIRGKLSGEFSGRYRIIYLLAVAEAMLCIIFPGQLQIYDHDTWTYLETWGNYDIFRPSTFVDIYRTPVYPLFLGITTLNQQLPMATVVLVQWIVFIASIPFFKRLSFMLVRRKSITFWMTLFYAAFWGSIEVNYCLMTESLSQSLIVMFVYFTVRSILRPGAKSIYCSALCLLILVFLRPAMLYLPVIYIAVCVYIWTRNHREGLRGLLSATAICLSLYGYASAFNHQHGFFAMSDVSDYNNYIRCVTFGINDEKCYPPYLLPHLTTTDSVTGQITWTRDIPPYVAHTKDFHDGVTTNIKTHPDKFALATVWTFTSFWRCRANQCLFLYWPIGMMLTLGMDTAAVMVMIYLIIAVAAMWRSKVLMPVPLLIAGIWIAHALVSWLGAYWAFDRLIQPVFPMLILIFGQLCSFYTKTRTAAEVFHPL